MVKLVVKLVVELKFSEGKGCGTCFCTGCAADTKVENEENNGAESCRVVPCSVTVEETVTGSC